MGGVGSGGFRVRGGRKKKSAAEHFVTGDAGRRGRVLEHPKASSAPEMPRPTLGPVECPALLTPEERAVWDDLAPHAIRLETLTPATREGFGLLCQNIIRERKYGSSLTECGSGNHRGLIQRVEIGLDAYGLRPRGKAVEEAEAPVISRLERFVKHG